MPHLQLTTDNLKEKDMLAWMFILKSSQTSSPPPVCSIEMKVYIVEGIICATWMVDPKMFGIKTIPVIGQDMKLIRLLIMHVSYIQGP